MCPNRVYIFLTTLLLIKKGCGFPNAATRQSVLHISPPVITPAPSSFLHKLQGRNAIPHKESQLTDINKLSELVKRSTTIDVIDCWNSAQLRGSTADIDDDDTRSVSKVVKKKTVIGSDRVGLDEEDEMKPVKRVLSAGGVVSKPMKKTLDPIRAASLTGLIKKTIETTKGSTGLSSLIQTLKNKAISSILTNINTNTRTGARKSITESPKSKLESFLASAGGSDPSKSDTTVAKSEDVKPKTDIKVAEAGKSILAAIDDKEGLRAALAKAIDRVEKVVANKNGALKELAEKKGDEKKREESKTSGASRSSSTDSTFNVTISRTGNATQSKSETKSGGEKNKNTTAKLTESTESTPAKSSDSAKASSNTTKDKGNSTVETPTTRESNKEANKESTKEGAKESTKEVNKESSKEATKEASKEATKEASKEATKEASKEATKETDKESPKTTDKDSAKETGATNKTEAEPSPPPAPPPAPVVHDPYAEIAMGPDKPKIPELKNEEADATSQPGVMKLGAEGAAADPPAGGGAGVVGDGKPLAGMHDVGGLLDSLTDKVNLADSKGTESPPGLPDAMSTMLDRAQDKFNGLDTKGTESPPGLPDAMSTMLDRAQDKLNGLGADMGGDGTPAASNEVKYMQSQLPDNANPASQDDGSPKLIGDPTATNKDTMNPLKPPMMGGGEKMMGDDSAMKALAGGGGGPVGGGDEEIGGARGAAPSSEIKPMEKEDVFNNMLKNQGTDGDDESSMKNMGSLKDESHIKDDVSNEGNDDNNDMPPTSHMHKPAMDDEETAPILHDKDIDTSEGLVKDIMDKAGSLNPSPNKGAGEDFKEFQGADISPGPDPYDSDKTGEAYGTVYGAGGRMKGKQPFRDEDSYDNDMPPSAHDMPPGAGEGDGVQGFGPRGTAGGGDDSFGDNYDKGGSDFNGPPHESIESNDEQQMPGRNGDGAARGLDSYLNMAAVNPLAPETFQTRQVIPEHGWRSGVTGSGSGRGPGGSFHDNYNAQLFKKNVIMRPEKDVYESPFHDKTSYEVEQ